MTESTRTTTSTAPSGDGVPALPPIYCPIQPSVHPAALVNRNAIQWMRDRGFCESPAVRRRLEVSNVAGFVARILPQGDSSTLEAITKLHLWAFAFDDSIEQLAVRNLAEAADRQSYLVRILDAPRSALLADDPYVHSFREVWELFQDLASPAVLRRWVEQFRMFASGVVWGCVYRQLDVIPTSDTVTTIRIQDAAGGCTGTGLVEVAGRFEVADEDLARSDVRALTDMTHVILAWDNDIYSYPLESGKQIEHVNLVTTLVVHDSLTERQALIKAINMRNRAMWCYTSHRRKVFAPEGGPLQRYLRGLDHLIRGHLDWALNSTRRYDSGEHPVPALVLQEESATQIDGHDLTQPIDLPTIRWWWDDIHGGTGGGERGLHASSDSPSFDDRAPR
ncbi:hypothetical protein ACFFQW_38445 [Umezawaea endophytica]|uniref:Terpene synthase n=1 Tax=Umezawaea endophytica TaxID=1654476 RepID=A0A9X3A5H8_9PSEU|nr:hypothetical protein [Umezawaea endophytica]MCS7483824.1 hypothetical protein [Umezawaea endophytica]